MLPRVLQCSFLILRFEENDYFGHFEIVSFFFLCVYVLFEMGSPVASIGLSFVLFCFFIFFEPSDKFATFFSAFPLSKVSILVPLLLSSLDLLYISYL